MSDFVTCSSCGARNGGEAVWCTMCFEPLRAADSGIEDVPATEEPSTREALSETADPPSGDGDPSVDRSGGATWACRACESVNTITVDICPVCGTTIFESMGARTDQIQLTPDQVVRLGLVPGLAHGRLGEPVLGFIIGLLVVASLAFGVLLALSGGVVWGVVVGMVGLSTWGIAFFDANLRVAGSPPVLGPRVITVIGGVMVLIIMIAGFVAGATAARGAGS